MNRIPHALAFLLYALVGCAPMPPTPEGRTQLHSDVNRALAEFNLAIPGLEMHLAKSPGYAIFPSIAKGGAGFGGAYGVGEVFERGEFVGYCNVTQGTLGIQIGGQVYKQLLVFFDEGALKRFKIARFVGAIQTSGVGGTAGASIALPYEYGVEVYVLPSAGLMGEASAGGQQFAFTPAAAATE